MYKFRSRKVSRRLQTMIHACTPLRNHSSSSIARHNNNGPQHKTIQAPAPLPTGFISARLEAPPRKEPRAGYPRSETQRTAHGAVLQATIFSPLVDRHVSGTTKPTSPASLQAASCTFVSVDICRRHESPWYVRALCASRSKPNSLHESKTSARAESCAAGDKERRGRPVAHRTCKWGVTTDKLVTRLIGSSKPDVCVKQRRTKPENCAIGRLARTTMQASHNLMA